MKDLLTRLFAFLILFGIPISLTTYTIDHCAETREYKLLNYEVIGHYGKQACDEAVIVFKRKVGIDIEPFDEVCETQLGKYYEYRLTYQGGHTELVVRDIPPSWDDRFVLTTAFWGYININTLIEIQNTLHCLAFFSLPVFMFSA